MITYFLLISLDVYLLLFYKALTELKEFMIVNSEPKKERQKLLRNLRVSAYNGEILLKIPIADIVNLVEAAI